MESRNLISGINVPGRLQSCLHAKEFSAKSLRAAAMGALLAIAMSDIALYNQLQISIKHGQMPWYIADVLIMTIGSLEALSAPLWSWFGKWRIRTMMFVSLLAAATTLSLLMLPSVPEGVGSELCTSVPSSPAYFTSMSTAGAMRLAVIILIALVNMVGKAAIWNNALVLMDIGDPGEMSLNCGILVAVRILTVVMLPKVLTEDMAIWTQAVGAFAPLLIHSVQFFRLPEPVTQGDLNSKVIDTSFGASSCRVLSSGPVMGLTLAMSLLVSSLWGYKWHDSEIIKMLYFIVESKDFVSNQSEILIYHALILAVVTYGLYYSRTKVFDKVSALKLATIAALIATPLYSVLTLLLVCQPGLVGGLEQTFNYTQPSCSNQCQCAVPYSQFAPVCVPDTMTTYLSPCHAGCSVEDIIAGVKSYRACNCALPGNLQRATVGACSAVQCSPYYILHKVLTACIVILVVLAIQALLVTVLRLVDPFDRPAAVGLTSAVVLLLTFCCSHLAFFGIRVSSCAWEEGGRCHLHSPTFLKATGGASTGLAGLSSLICLVTLVVIKRTHVGTEEIPMRTVDIS